MRLTGDTLIEVNLSINCSFFKDIAGFTGYLQDTGLGNNPLTTSVILY